MIYGYIRVSTDRQDTENQRFEINNFAERNGFVIDKFIEETISGTKEWLDSVSDINQIVKNGKVFRAKVIKKVNEKELRKVVKLNRANVINKK